MSMISGAPFIHIGGQVVSDHGPLALLDAEALADFYRTEGDWLAALGATGLGGACLQRAAALRGAIVSARAWRRAAGWRDPSRADGPARTARF